MRVSQKSEYALAAILDLTLQRPGVFTKVAGISNRQQIPGKFLELILAELKQRGFVTSRRGAEGGYQLAKRPDCITVGEVLACLGERRTRKINNGLTDLWNRVERSAWGILDRTTFAELAVPPAQETATDGVALLNRLEVITPIATGSPNPGQPQLAPPQDGRSGATERVIGGAIP